jgi:O-antigen/teichoic acid export membrane protein
MQPQTQTTILRKVPVAIIASSMPGFVNYAIVLFLTYQMSAADVGDYRLIISAFSLLGLASMLESTKVFVRSATEDDTSNYATVFILRLASSAGLLALASFVMFQFFDDFGIGWKSFFSLAVLSLIYHPLDLANSWFQAKRQFGRFALASIAKNLGALSVFVLLVYVGTSVIDASLLQIAFLTLANAVIFLQTVGPAIFRQLRTAFQPLRRLSSNSSREGIVLSAANALPNSLEHIDKLLIGAFFGLEALGIYTLGFSTGRFIYNSLKPALYVYYHSFVEKMPSNKANWLVFLSFTAVGVLLSVLFLFAIHNIAALAKFLPTATVTVIIFLSYGIAMVDVVYAQAFALNKHTKSNNILIANLIACFACVLLFAAATRMDTQLAMIAFASHYPLRHGLTFLILTLLKKPIGVT